MAKKFRLLLLDANVVIEAFRMGIWDQLVDRCDIHLARTVVDKEAHFYEDDSGDRHHFDLREYEAKGTITVFDVQFAEVDAFRKLFGPVYFEKLDQGEAESMAFLFAHPSQEWLICSADKIVYRVLGSTRRGDQGISLEEILQQIGLGRPVDRMFSHNYREQWTRKGFEEGQYGLHGPP